MVCAVVSGWPVARAESTRAESTRAIEVPVTLARNIQLGREGRVSVGLPPTHVAFSWSGSESSALRYRLISAGVVSRWRWARESDEMETADRHFSAVFVVDRPDAIEWDVVNGAVDAVTLHEMNTIDGPRHTIEAPAGTPSLASAPDIVTRAEWGADETIKRTSGDCARRFFDVQQLFVHHTAGTNHDPNPSATMRAIYWYHVQGRGWCDIGYNFVIGSDGRIFEARWARSYRPWEVHDSENSKGQGVVGAHVAGFNSGSIGMSLMGNYENVELPTSMRESLVALLAWEADRHGLPARGSHVYRNPDTGATRRLPYIAGHRDAGQTACPGRNVYSDLKKIRTEVAAMVATGKAAALVRLGDVAETVDFGEEAVLGGRLRDQSGAPLAGRTVSLYVRGVGRWWAQKAQAITDTDGRFSFPLELRRTSDVVVTFAGDETAWEDESRLIRVGVRPLVSLAPDGGDPNSDGVYYFDATTRYIKFFGDVEPRHPGGLVRVRVSKLRKDGTYRELVAARRRLDSVGAYRYRFDLPDRRSGTYRAVSRFHRDADHLGASSPRVDFVVSAK
jgi:hypothetical protein